LIDEPELHFHPRTQKLLMRYLLEHSKARLFVATHSAAIIDASEGAILHVEEKSGKTTAKSVSSNLERFESVRNLGHSPSELVQANFVLWVEGPSDRVYFLKWLSLVRPELVEGIDFAILLYGGSVLASHTFDEGDADLVKAFSVCRQFAVYMDSDRAKAGSTLKTRVTRVVNEAAAAGGMAWVSDGREIENYVPASIIKSLSYSY
jgi:hypothetical protein